MLASRRLWLVESIRTTKSVKFHAQTVDYTVYGTRAINSGTRNHSHHSINHPFRRFGSQLFLHHSPRFSEMNFTVFFVLFVFAISMGQGFVPDDPDFTGPDGMDHPKSPEGQRRSFTCSHQWQCDKDSSCIIGLCWPIGKK